MKYYLHDSNSFNDEKITELFINFGYEGLGLFYTLLEKLAAQEKPIKTNVLKTQLKVGKRLEKCWEFMESLGIVSSNNGETFNERILSYSERYKIKSEKNKKRISEWRKNQGDTENVTHYEQVCNASKVKESKVKESKVKENDNKALLQGNGKFLNTLSEMEIGQTVQFSSITLHRKYDSERITSLWEAFCIQSEEKYYPSRKEKVNHFRNWLKTQPDEKDKRITTGSRVTKSTGAENLLESLRQDYINLSGQG